MLRQTVSFILTAIFVASLLPVFANGGEKKAAPVGPAPVLDEKGELKKSDKAPPNASYSVKFEAGKIYRIELRSDKFDAVLKLEDDAKKVVAEDDDSAGNLNARIYYKANKSSEHTIVVTTQNRQVGAFTLNVTLATDRTVASEYPNKAIDLQWTDGKTHYKGSLDLNDGNALGRYYKVFTIRLDQGKRYQIDHRSNSFDAYLVLEDADGKRLAHNDDGGEKLNARLTFTPTKTATYRIIATSLPTRQLGDFVLDIAMSMAKAAADERPFDESRLTPFHPFVQVLSVDSSIFR